MITFHPSAPASRIAHARQPLRRRLMSAFHPFSAHSARTRISMSEPNCRRRVSEYVVLLLSMLLVSASLLLVPARCGCGSCCCCCCCGEDGDIVTGDAVTVRSAPSTVSLDEMLSRPDHVRLCIATGETGISCACGRGWKPVMQSTTSTSGSLPLPLLEIREVGNASVGSG